MNSLQLRPDNQPQSGQEWITNGNGSPCPQLGASTLFIFLLGGLFVALGSGIVAYSHHVFIGASKSISATDWRFVFVFGLAFALAGLGGWALGAGQFFAERRRLISARSHPSEPIFADFPWNPSGIESTPWKRPIINVYGLFTVALIALLVTLAAFNATPATPGWVKALAVFFDLGMLFAWGYTGFLFIRALKFGRTRLLYDRCPFRRGEPVRVRWVPAQGITQVNSGTFTLRCVKETCSYTRGPWGGNRNISFEVLWRNTWLLTEQSMFSPLEEIALSFLPPLGAPATTLNASPPTYWEFEVKLKLPGLDFKETYLVPIY